MAGFSYLFGFACDNALAATLFSFLVLFGFDKILDANVASFLLVPICVRPPVTGTVPSRCDRSHFRRTPVRYGPFGEQFALYCDLQGQTGRPTR